MTDRLSEADRSLLLNLARQALEQAVSGKTLSPLDYESLPESLRQPGATFVTLTSKGQLRGCIGALEPSMPLAQDVREHAVAAGFQDYRFRPLQAAELPEIAIEISRLTTPQPLEYQSTEDLLSKLRPGIDGVILLDGIRRATFLPQVWQKIPNKADFLSQLCYKMGAAPDTWRTKKLQVKVYQVEEFHE